MEIQKIKGLLGLSEQAEDQELEQALKQAGQIRQAFQRKRIGLGLHAQAAPEEVLTLLDRPETEVVTELRHTIVTMSEEVGALRKDILRADAMRAIEKFGAERPISAPMIETLVNLHMQNPESAIQIMSALPKLNQRFQWPDARNSTEGNDVAVAPMDAEIKRNMV